MVSVLPLIACSSSLLSKRLWTVPSASTTISITVTLMFHILWQDLNICLSYCFLWFSLCDQVERENPDDNKFCFFSFSCLLFKSTIRKYSNDWHFSYHNNDNLHFIQSVSIYMDPTWLLITLLLPSRLEL